MDGETVERKQQRFMFIAALLYALPLVLPVVRYLYRSFDELSHYVLGLAAISNLWAFAIVVLLVELFLSIVIYNLLGIYVERMNGALAFFRRMGRSVVDGSRVAVVVGSSLPGRVASGVRGAMLESVRAGFIVAASSASVMRRSIVRYRTGLRRVVSSRRWGASAVRHAQGNR